MSINDLTAVVPPPDTPAAVPAKLNWKEIEKALGVLLPMDYKDFVARYGSGLLGNFIRVFNPFDEYEYMGLVPSVVRICGIRRELKESEGDAEVPFDVYPKSPGLLPWGNDENGNGLYWLTEGATDHWPCIVGAGRDRRWQRFDMTMTTFLATALNGDVKCRIWPSGFARPNRRRVFTPY
jgi:hypothetical protein